MEPFEYLSVLVSIILGLGITQLLGGFGRWLEQRSTFRAHGPAIAWAGFILIVHVQTWWSMFDMRHAPDWTFLQFSIVLLQPAVLYLLAILALPGAGSAERDLRANFYIQRRWFFGLFMFLLVVSIVKDLVRTGGLPDGVNLAFHGLFFAIAAAAYATGAERYHRWLAYGGLVTITLYIALLFARLS